MLLFERIKRMMNKPAETRANATHFRICMLRYTRSAIERRFEVIFLDVRAPNEERGERRKNERTGERRTDFI